MSCAQTWKSIPDVVDASQISAAWVARMRHSAAPLHQPRSNAGGPLGVAGAGFPGQTGLILEPESP